MKNFLSKLFIISISMFLLLWCLQSLIDNGLRINKKNLYQDWYKIYNTDINADIVFLGSSRTVKHYDPKIFEDNFNSVSYNLGTYGTRFDMQKLKYNIYLDINKPPKIIIQNVDIKSLQQTNNLYSKEQYLPYYTLQNYKYLKLGDESLTMEYIVPMYKYRSFYRLFEDVYEGYAGMEQAGQQNYKGYYPSDISWNYEFEQKTKENQNNQFDYSDLNINKRMNIFSELLSDLKKTDTYIFLVWAPEIHERLVLEGKTLTKVRSEYDRIAKANERVYFIDFTKDSICYNKKYFYNWFHLNKDGAELFSQRVADSVNKYLID
jgi:hypothetical protein